MKELNEMEFQDRLLAINRAMHIFGELTGGHITKAFQAYQEIFAEREREIFMSHILPAQEYLGKVERKYEIVQCPGCSREMYYRPLGENNEGYKLQWVCSNPDCDVVLNSENDITWWMDQLRIVGRKHAPIGKPIIASPQKR